MLCLPVEIERIEKVCGSNLTPLKHSNWMDENDVWQARLFDSAQMDVSDGDKLLIDQGEIVEHTKCHS